MKTSSADRQTELPQTPDKRSVSISRRIGQGEDANVKDKILGRNDDSEQGNNQRIEIATPFRASHQDEARSGNLDTFRQYNSSLRYWEMESEGIPERQNKARILNSTSDSLSRLSKYGGYNVRIAIFFQNRCND
ncbi:MAG: hypothetical protein EZS28_001539 [Streblomastix strix]|uniref:Uncharacterized protein n=1 Tax=Streblomastix strix TaxID=222440 RepID=A0A5J4X6V1_9EUKA|nr:MAG: hypothetical protein EZS28_001539 [Streblomastix strix]